MKAGDKVVCMDDDWSKSWDDPKRHANAVPVKGQTYVIRAWVTARNGEPGLQLIGCDALHDLFICFYPWRFRLLSELKETNNQNKNNDTKHPDRIRESHAFA